MNKRPSYLCALDIGTKNTGIAITDLSWFLTARPLGQVQTSSFTRDFDKLLLQSSSDSSGSSIKKEKISGYIVGMPYHHHHYNYNIKEEKVDQCNIVKEITTNLQLNKPIVYIDERLTTAHAKQQYINSRRRSKSRDFQSKRDELAAVMILERFQSQSKTLLPLLQL
jgi:putative transcription antitermination factor YqgF